MRLRSRVEKVEAAIAAKEPKEPKEPIRIVRIIVNPNREAISARYNGMTIDRTPGESEEDFRARVDKEIRKSDPGNDSPVIPLPPDDINL